MYLRHSVCLCRSRTRAFRASSKVRAMRERWFNVAPRIAPSNGPLRNSLHSQEIPPPLPPHSIRLTQAYVVILHAITGLFFYGVARLHVYIRSTRELDASIQLSLGNPTTDFFKPVLVT